MYTIIHVHPFYVFIIIFIVLRLPLHSQMTHCVYILYIYYTKNNDGSLCAFAKNTASCTNSIQQQQQKRDNHDAETVSCVCCGFSLKQ